MKLTCWLLFLLVIVLLNATQEGFANNSMNLFANKMSPFCKSSYSSESGFICLTDQQKHILDTRGGNRTIDAD
uniref:Uncharacterized protein n=1 Tax=viral metagenome TaxID=1070528 RepID=A0A6C0B9K6_9ZZZZ